MAMTNLKAWAVVLATFAVLLAAISVSAHRSAEDKSRLLAARVAAQEPKVYTRYKVVRHVKVIKKKVYVDGPAPSVQATPSAPSTSQPQASYSPPPAQPSTPPPPAQTQSS